MANAENNESVEMIEVEVACAVEGTQEVIALRMPAGSTLSDAVVFKQYSVVVSFAGYG